MLSSKTFQTDTKVILAACIASVLSACAGRAPQPVAVVQAQDHSMDCAAIIAEVQANNTKVQDLASEKGLKVGQNVVTGVAGFLIPVLWFGMDWQGTQDKEITALQTRQQYLATLAEQRQCGATQPANTPKPRSAQAKKEQIELPPINPVTGRAIEN
jgi:hypothetical protein